MKRLIKPKALNIGDTVATISLSWGGAAVFRKRYEQGVHQFKEAFGVNVIFKQFMIILRFFWE